MRRVLAEPVRAARRQVEDDLRADPYLGYILLLAAVLAGFWIWHRLPNFATRDERWRVVDAIEAFAALSERASYDSLREGVTYWRSYGATFYVGAVVLIPVALAAAAAGQLDGFADMGRHVGVSFWRHWLRTPGWLWTASVLAMRLVNVALTVGSVYLVYRTGTAARDRATGRLAALLLTFTWGVLVLAHEAGEGIPALFFFLLAFHLAQRYLRTGAKGTFYWGCVAGGLAAAMKLNGGASALVLGAAFLLRARREDGALRERFVRPRFLLTGVGIGTVLILVGYPSVIVGDPAELGGRLLRLTSEKDTPHGWRVKPSWWWIARGYLHGLGLPLAAASAASLAASVSHLRERSPAADAVRLALVAVGTLLAVYSTWAYVRTHHLLLTFPLLVLVVAIAARRLHESRPGVARPLVALLLVTSGAYAVGGDLGYAAQPRDKSVDWLNQHATGNATIETYVGDPQEAGVPHDASVHPVRHPIRIVDMPDRCPDYIVLNYHRSLLYLAPEEWGLRASVLSNDRVERYVRALLAEDTYPYEVAATFGRRPRFLDGNGRRSTLQEFLYVGTRPRTMQYGDPQDFGVDQYTVILERTGECEPGREVPPVTARTAPGRPTAGRLRAPEAGASARWAGGSSRARGLTSPRRRRSRPRRRRTTPSRR